MKRLSIPAISGYFKKDPPQVDRCPLTYSLTSAYPDSVMSSSDPMHRVVGKSRGQMVYSIFAPRLSRRDIGNAEIVKASAISALASNPAMSCGKRVDQIKLAYETCAKISASMDFDEDRRTMAYLVAHDIVGYGPFSMLLEDSEGIEEIEVNSPVSEISVYHREYGRCKTNLKFNDEAAFRYSVNRLIDESNKELNSTTPIIDVQLSDGSRLHAQLWPYSASGALACIRINGGRRVDIRRLMSGGSVTPQELAYLWMALETDMNIIAAGAPAAGKTSFICALSAFMQGYERVVTIEEDVNELRFYNNFINVVPLQSRVLRVPLLAQVRNALHLRPDRLVVGELRGEEATSVFSAANLGVPFATTVHCSEDAGALLNRLSSKPMSVEESVLSMLDISVYLARGPSGRKVRHIDEYLWLSRSEAEPDEALDTRFKNRICRISENGTVDMRALSSSKVLSRFAEINAVSRSAALNAFRRRSKYLESVAPFVQETPASECISMYTGP